MSRPGTGTESGALQTGVVCPQAEADAWQKAARSRRNPEELSNQGRSKVLHQSRSAFVQRLLLIAVVADLFLIGLALAAELKLRPDLRVPFTQPGGFPSKS
jgi:hypothetical protein